MSDEITQAVAANSKPDGTDIFLRQLVTLTNESGLSQAVTLHVNGTIVTGHIVSMKEYLEALTGTLTTIFADTFRQMPDDGTMSEEDIAKWEKNSRASQSEKVDAKLAEQPKREPQYIHLLDVSIYPIVTGRMNSQFPYWRFALADVSGWTLGRAELT